MNEEKNVSYAHWSLFHNRPGWEDVSRMVWATAKLSVKNTIRVMSGFSMYIWAAAEAPLARAKSLPS